MTNEEKLTEVQDLINKALILLKNVKDPDIDYKLHYNCHPLIIGGENYLDYVNDMDDEEKEEKLKSVPDTVTVKLRCLKVILEKTQNNPETLIEKYYTSTC